ncbi:MAG: cardiolipin synthase [Nevskiaceae bacterium]|nr:MAG: cardiolipin synthase [Nevskiaceae bacterium]TAM26689.1 MAG: cardiolipin synthase [Nevskiaceae bacterium]
MNLALPAGSHWLLALDLLLVLPTVAHVLLHKRDPRSAWGWIAVCALFPLAGPALYWLFGVNRIEQRARQLLGTEAVIHAQTQAQDSLFGSLPDAESRELRELVRLGSALTGRPLTTGNRITPLRDGDEAYPAMLRSIAEARHTLHLASYIYLGDACGEEFALALAAAQARGVRLRVLLDGAANAWYRPRASQLLARHGIQAALFLPPRWFPPLLHLNLRNHRKLLIADGEIAYTGGMNIAGYHRGEAGQPAEVTDLHFRIEGPLVAQLEQVFLADWHFATGEATPVAVATGPAAGGQALARAVTDGPNEELDRLLMLLLGALANAHQRVWIMTPYFLPTAPLIGALQSAALRGVDVCLVLPAKNDQPWMTWATRNVLWQLLDRQVRVLERPGPFAHSKLLLVDDYYLQFGSANLDQRSLRLNFELVVESYDRALAAWAAAHFEELQAVSRPISRAELDARPLPQRLRDALCWLMSPYL